VRVCVCVCVCVSDVFTYPTFTMADPCYTTGRYARNDNAGAYLLQNSDGRLPRFRLMVCTNSRVRIIRETTVPATTKAITAAGIKLSAAVSVDVVDTVDIAVTFRRRTNPATRAL